MSGVKATEKNIKEEIMEHLYFLEKNPYLILPHKQTREGHLASSTAPKQVRQNAIWGVRRLEVVNILR